MKNIVLISVLLISLSISSFASFTPPDTIKITQGNTPNKGNDTSLILDAPNPPLNNVWKKINNPNAKIVPYTYINEEYVMWSKRVWREIDLRQKKNQPLYYPLIPVRDRKSFAQVIIDAVTKGYVLGNGENKTDTIFLTAYETEDMKRIYNKKMVGSLFESSLDSMPTDTNGDGVTDLYTQFKNETGIGDIIKIRLVEQWFFDRERSVMDVRTVAFCLLMDEYKYLPGPGNSFIRTFFATKELFWINFAEARPLLSQAECYNTKNDGARLSFDDIFWKRWFDGYIVKVENVYDRPISDMGQDKGYLKGLDALLEGEKIKNEMIEFEHNLWEY